MVFTFIYTYWAPTLAYIIRMGFSNGCEVRNTVAKKRDADLIETRDKIPS